MNILNWPLRSQLPFCLRLAAALGLAVATGALIQAQPASLADRYPPESLEQILVPRGEWHPFPRYGDRAEWQALPENARLALVKRGEDALTEPWPDLPAALYLEYARVGNRSRFESVYFERRKRLHAVVLAECVEAEGRFVDGIVNALWSICEESSWCIPAHVGVQKAGVGLPDIDEPIVDLFAAQTAVSVAWTLYLAGPQIEAVAPRVVTRAEREVDRRVLTPYLERDYGWMGFGAKDRSARPNNWNPWINASVLTAALVLEPDAERRVRLVHRVMRSVDRFIQPYPEDGGCDEGPGYWSRAGGSVQDNLDLLFTASGGKISVFDDPLIQDIGRFIHRAHIADDWYVAIGDCPARTGIDRDLVYRYGRAIGDPELQALGTAGAKLDELVRATDSLDLGRALHTLANLPEILARSGASPPLVADAWLGSDDMQMMVARDEPGSTRGLFVSAWGGHNAQSHNHNDVGNVVVFADGQPVLVDLGAPTYAAQTFSSRRYEIPAMQSEFHNLPTINGVQQSAGREFAARQVVCHLSDSIAELTMDIAAAWPTNAAVNSWRRTVRLERSREIVIDDHFELAQVLGETSVHFMTPRPVHEVGPGQLRFELPAGTEGGHLAVLLRYPADRLEAVLETVPMEDGRLRQVWGDALTRVVLRQKTPVSSDRWTLGLALAR